MRFGTSTIDGFLGANDTFPVVKSLVLETERCSIVRGMSETKSYSELLTGYNSHSSK